MFVLYLCCVCISTNIHIHTYTHYHHRYPSVRARHSAAFVPALGAEEEEGGNEGTLIIYGGSDEGR